MKLPNLALWCVLALVVAGCAKAPAPSTNPAPPVPDSAMAATATLVAAEAVSTPMADQLQATEGPKPTITVNPHLHATNPQNVKLGSGDQPTLVEFFAFW